MTGIMIGFTRARHLLGTVYGNYSLTAADTGINAAGPNGGGSGDSTITLPATPSTNQTITINNTGTGTVTVNGNGNEITKTAIDYGSGEMSAAASITISWNGTTWDVVTESGTIVYIVSITYATFTFDSGNIILSGGDLTFTTLDGGGGTVISSIAKSSGKWYCEFTCTGIDVSLGKTFGPYLHVTAAANIGYALDLDGGTLDIYSNGVFHSTQSFTPASCYVAVSIDYEIGSVTANFGATAFAYTPPVGYNSGLYT